MPAGKLPETMHGVGARNVVVLLIAMVGVAISIVIRCELYVFDRETISHDEAITILYASGQLGAYGDASKVFPGQWVPADELKIFTRVDAWKSPAALARDIGNNGNHPPLYFWLAHVWGNLFGAETLRALNVLLVSCTAISLFAFGRGYFRDDLSAALTVLLWCASPEVIRVSAHMRSYELLTLIVVLFAWQVVRVVRRQSRSTALHYISISLLGAAGLLTHYYALLMLLAAFIALLVYRRDALLPYLGAVAGSALVFLTLHPTFYHVAGHGQVLAKAVTLDVYAERIVAIGATWLGFYGWRSYWTTLPVGILVFAVSVAGMAALAIYVARRREHGAVLCFLLVPAALIEFLMLFGIVPTHGLMSARYLAIVWPFFALLHVLILARAMPVLRAAAIVTLSLVVAPALLWVATLRSEPNLPVLIANADRIVLDNTGVGILPRYIRHAKEGALVFAQGQEDLIRNANAWVRDLKPGDVLISNPTYSGSPEGQRRLISIVDRIHGADVSYSEFATTIVTVK